MTAANVTMKLEGNLDHLRIVWQTGEALLENLTFGSDTEGTRYNVLVSLQEMVTNVMRHGYEGDDSRPIEVEFRCDDDRFSVELRDSGPAFDPLGHAFDPDQPSFEDVDTVGGYGIMIARTVMDRIEYERRDSWNCLRLTKLAAPLVAGVDQN